MGVDIQGALVTTYSVNTLEIAQKGTAIIAQSRRLLKHIYSLAEEEECV